MVNVYYLRIPEKQEIKDDKGNVIKTKITCAYGKVVKTDKESTKEKYLKMGFEVFKTKVV